MRSAIVLIVAGLATAAPHPQGLDWQEIEAAGTPTLITPPNDVTTDVVKYDSEAAQASASAAVSADPATPATKSKRDLERRDPCEPQPSGYGPPTYDLYTAFLRDPVYPTYADGAPTPQGYTEAFRDLQASVEGIGYMGLYTLRSYDTIKCQQLCDEAPACYAFNTYYERDPSLDPAPACPDPPSTINIKCTLWGTQISSAQATNRGQRRQDFYVVISGSRGFNKIAPPPAVDDFTGPVTFGGAISAPSGYMGAKVYPGQVIDPNVCAAACNAQTAYNQAHPAADGTYDTCEFFNMYVLSENNQPQGLTCSLYNQVWDESYATNTGSYQGSTYYGVSQSYGYSLISS